MGSSYLLELGNGLRCSQDTLGSVGGSLGCLAVVPSAKELIEPGDKELVCATKIVPHGHPQRQLTVVQGVLEREDGVTDMYEWWCVLIVTWM